MPGQTQWKPVEDTVAKINDEIAVGSDIQFQRKWWRFERTMWILFTLIIVADVLGCFGRGFVAKANARTGDGSMDVKYERIERFSTPSILRVDFGQNAVKDGKVQLWIADTLVKALGNQRVVPQPENSILQDGGILYTFPATKVPATVEFALQPAGAGMKTLQFFVPGFEKLTLKVFVMP